MWVDCSLAGLDQTTQETHSGCLHLQSNYSSCHCAQQGVTGEGGSAEFTGMGGAKNDPNVAGKCV